MNLLTLHNGRASRSHNSGSALTKSEASSYLSDLNNSNHINNVNYLQKNFYKSLNSFI